jgi:hypothetical protein
MNKQLYEKGFDDKYMGDHKGEFNAWFISDMICLTSGNVSCTGKEYVEVTTYDYKKRICIYLDQMKFICWVGDDYSYTQKDYLAFEGFCAKYNLQFEEWSDE